jgi:hypothetical protein
MNRTGESKGQRICITLEDLESVRLNDPHASGEPQSYGSVSAASSPVFAQPEVTGGLLMRAWFYLGTAGLIGAVIAWGICEPWFIDGNGKSWANQLLIPMMVALMCSGFGVAEGIVEHSAKRAITRGLLSLAAGTVLGFIFYFAANVIFNIGLGVLTQLGGYGPKNPALWLVRAIAWMGFGISGGLVYGVIGQSAKRCGFGILGGLLGAGLGGFVFDPISIVFSGAAMSRAIGLALFGAATGIAMGLVESALKDRWLYVAAGPLAGKQFVLYKSLTTLGSNDSCDVYLFKDPAVQPQHACLEIRGSRVVLRPAAPVLVNGRSAGERLLNSGDYIQIGRYSFHYRDRERSAS